MKNIYNCFLISFIVHVFFIAISCIILSKLKENKDFTVSVNNSIISVNMVSSSSEMINNEQQLLSNKDKINQLHYEVKNAALTVKNQKSQKVQSDKNNKKCSDNKGKNFANNDTDINSNEIIPVIDNHTNKIINVIAPKYPTSSLALGHQGTVIIRLLVSSEGQILLKEIYQSSGYKSLDDVVLKVSNLWTVRFAPIKLSRVDVAINFIIK